MWAMCDWDIRVRTPVFLRLAGLSEHATALKALPEIVDLNSLSASEETVERAAAAARTAYEGARSTSSYEETRLAERVADWVARETARGAARAAAYAANYAARNSAVLDVAWTVYEAARSPGDLERLRASRKAPIGAANSAADEAALAVAYRAPSETGAIFTPTVEELQESFVRLMIRIAAELEAKGTLGYSLTKKEGAT